MVTPNGTNGINGFGGFDDERETLLHTALFKQVSSEEARELLPYLQHAEYDKGDFIFREGDTDHRMYLGPAFPGDPSAVGEIHQRLVHRFA